MLEKGKGRENNKRIILDWIEVDMQLLMRIFLVLMIDEEHEMDKIFPKYNYGCRQYFLSNQLC